MINAPELTDIGDLYRTTRLRVSALVNGLRPEQHTAAVPACPGWRVHDVIAHLVGIIEDALAGLISGPPPPALTGEQVARHRNDDVASLIARWAELAPLFEAALTERQIWSALIDVLTHEQDIRGALGLPGARTEPALLHAAQQLAALDDRSVTIVVNDGPRRGGVTEAGCTLRVSAFELLRFRLGRRTRTQALDLDWTGDPEPYIDALFIFGPAAEPIIE